MLRTNFQKAAQQKDDKNKDDESLLTIEEMNETGLIDSNLMAVLLLIAYLVMGLSWYTFKENNSPLVSIYFCVTTLMTIGYGDVTVENRAFGTFFVLMGAGVVGTIFGLVTFRIMEEQEVLTNTRLISLASKISKKGKEIHRYTSSRLSAGSSKKSSDSVESPISEENRQVSKWRYFCNLIKDRIKKIFCIKTQNENCEEISDQNMAVYDNEISDLKVTTVENVFLFLVTFFIGAICMSAIEGWKITDAMYWSAVTICTVGFGDLTPKTDGGRVFTIFFALIGCSLSVKGFSEVVRFPILLRLKKNEIHVRKQFLKGLSEKTLKNIIENDIFDRIPNFKSNDNEIKKSEFVIMLLTMMGKLPEREIILAATIFDKLDSNSDGVLNEEDWAVEVRRARARDRARTMEALEIEANRGSATDEFIKSIEDGIAAVTDTVRTYTENVMHHLVSLNPLQEDQSEESLRDRDRDRDREDHLHTTTSLPHTTSSLPHNTSLLPRWFRSLSAEKADLIPQDFDSDSHTIRMVENPILNSPRDVKSVNRSVRWNSDLNEKTSSYTIGRNSDGANDNSSTGGSDINTDFYYDSDDHDYYGGKSVFDTNSETSDQSAHPQNHGIENVKTANQRMRDDKMQKNNDSSGMKYNISNPFKGEKSAISHRKNDQNDRKTVNISKSDIIAQLERDGSSREVSTKNKEIPLTFPLIKNKMEKNLKTEEVIESERDYYSSWEEEKYDLSDKSTRNVKYNDNN